jgi:hypothetical protein
MATNYKLPKIAADTVVVLNTPLAADTVLANGVLTVLDEAGNVAIKMKSADFLSFNSEAASLGVANEIDVDLAGVTVIANLSYSCSFYGPYAQNFFGGGKETGAIYTTRTYNVSLPAVPAPTPTLLAAAFADRINADVNAYFTATAALSVLTVLADSADAGALVSETPVGTVVTQATAWVSPVGTTQEVLAQVNNAALVVGSVYDRIIVNFRKPINSNIVNGLKVIKDTKLVVYFDSANVGTAAAVALLESILLGTEAPAKYLGCPQV